MWTDQVIAYCERTDLSFWAEPVNALTNLAFVLAALWVWPLTARAGLLRALAVVLVAIGIGSFLWHTYATRWAGLADVLPILLFILLYLFGATRDMLRLGTGWAVLAVALFFPYAAGFVWLSAQVMPGLGANAAYFSVAVLIAAYGLWLRAEPVGRGLLAGALILCLSLGFRMADAAMCDNLAIGTHFMWHILNAVMLGWMIRVYALHTGRAARV